MKILYAAPVGRRYRAMEVETRLAAEDGHVVHLVAEQRPHWDRHELDPRVEVHWLTAGRARAAESRLVTWGLCRVPRGLLRRLRRGPLARPAGRALKLWNRRVAGRIEKRRKRRTDRLRRSLRRREVVALIERHGYDWLILCEPGAVDLLVDDLPGLLERRPGLRTTYSYEDFADLEAPDAR